jgi:hypothetical protein
LCTKNLLSKHTLINRREKITTILENWQVLLRITRALNIVASGSYILLRIVLN